MKSNNQIEYFADVCMLAGFASLIIELVFVVLKSKLIYDMGASNYRIFVLCALISATGFFAVSAMFRKYAVGWTWKQRKHKVIGWTLYDKNKKRWEDAHPDATKEDWEQVEEAIIKNIHKKKYKFDGYYHWYGITGCPVMEDRTVVMMSMRNWESIMKKAWGTHYREMKYSEMDIPKQVAGFSTKIKWMTREEIEARENATEENQKNKIDVEMLHKEKQKNLAWAVKFASSFFKVRGMEVNVDVCNAVGELLVRCYYGCKEKDAPSLRWIFDPTERSNQVCMEESSTRS